MTKGQEALENLKTLDLDAMENESPNWGWYYNSKNESKAQMVRKDLVNIEKELKALEIIKEKEPDISFLLFNLELKHYNSCVWKNQELTQEEYDLLKEVLKNETNNNS